VNTEPEPTNRSDRTALKQQWYTGCVVALLLATAFVIGGLLGGMAGGGLVLWATDVEISLLGTPPTPTATPAPSATPTSEDMISQVVPAVVTVVNQQAAAVRFGSTVDARILGSGIVIDRRGYIVTNYHVVEPISPAGEEIGELTVILTTGEALSAYLVASDEQQDLALLYVENGDMPAVNWGDSEQVRPGEWVVAIGSALGDFPNSVKFGHGRGGQRCKPGAGIRRHGHRGSDPNRRCHQQRQLRWSAGKSGG
jgi:S1-C subfamily serine protease